MNTQSKIFKSIAIVLFAFLFTLSRPVLASSHDNPRIVVPQFDADQLTLRVRGVRLQDIIEVRVGERTLDVFELLSAAESEGSVQVLIGDVPNDGADVSVSVALLDGSVLSTTISSAMLPAASCNAPFIRNTTRCGGTTASVAPNYPCCDNNSNGRATDSSDGNCTWYAAVKAQAVRGWRVPAGWGNASSWCTNAKYTTGWACSTARANTIAYVGRIGHVCWLSSISSDGRTATCSEQNCSTWSSITQGCFYTGTRTKTYSIANDSVKSIYCTDSARCK